MGSIPAKIFFLAAAKSFCDILSVVSAAGARPPQPVVRDAVRNGHYDIKLVTVVDDDIDIDVPVQVK
jgi:hypothetical protein